MVSQGFLDSLDKLMVISDEGCTCETCNNITCPACVAIQELDAMYSRLQDVLDMIERDYRE